MILKLTISLSFVFVLSTTLKCQQSTVASGGEANGEGGSVSYTMGLTFYEASFNEFIIVTPGLQHAYPIINQTGFTDKFLLALDYTVFPNPSKGLLYLKCKEGIPKDQEYILLNVTGKTLLRNKITSETMELNLNLFKENIFILNITDGGNILQSFKIIKY